MMNHVRFGCGKYNLSVGLPAIKHRVRASSREAVQPAWPSLKPKEPSLKGLQTLGVYADLLRAPCTRSEGEAQRKVMSPHYWPS